MTPGQQRPGFFEIEPGVAASGLSAEAIVATLKGAAAQAEEEVPEEKAQPPLVLSKVQMAEIIEAQIRQMFDKFKATHNKASGSYLDYRIVMHEWNKKNSSDAGPEAKRSLEISVIRNGEAKVLFRTAYAFTHLSQLRNEGEWKLTLWKEALYNLIGGGIMYGLVLEDARKEDPTSFTK